jgi:hypothetical protein
MNIGVIEQYIELIFSWPVVAFVAIIMFHKEIRELIGRIQRIQKGDFSIDIPSRQKQVNKKTFEKFAAKKPNSYEALYGFEKTYRLIFGSQLYILQLIENSPGKKTDEATLVALHNRTIWKRTYPFADYIGFLINTKLLEKKESIYFITTVGKNFLEYLRKNNIPLQKPDRVIYS